MGLCMACFSVGGFGQTSQDVGSLIQQMGGNGGAGSASTLNSLPSGMSLSNGAAAVGGTSLPVIRGGDNSGPNALMRTQGNTNGEQARFRRAPLEKSEFQKFVAETVGKELPIFGQEFFQNGGAAPGAEPNSVPVPANYTVGPGDELLIRAWGQIDADVRAVVDRNGTINIPKVGVFSVAGITMQDLPAHLKNAFSRVYRNFDLTVSLGQLRGVTVYLVGQVRQPGPYTLSSVSTAVNALYAAGGPTAAGSLRHIQIKRQDKTIAELDLYDLLMKGDKSKDVRLATGDVVYVPPVGPQIAIKGSVNSEAIFELKEKETPLSMALAWAGGLSSVAEGQRVTLDRIDAHKSRSAEQFNLDEQGEKRTVKDGDIVYVFSVTPRFRNTVTLTGFIAQPVRVPWHEGMRIKDLIPDKDALLSRDYWLRRNMAVLSPQERVQRALQQKIDRNVIAIHDPTSEVPGQVATSALNGIADDAKVFQKPLSTLDDVTGIESLPADPNARPEEVNWEYAAVERLLDDLSYTVIPFNLGGAILNNDPQQNLLLKPGDVVTIYSRSQMRGAVEKVRKFVTLEGEFANPGRYVAEPGETLRQLVARVGGVTPQAYLFGAEFSRESVRKEQAKRYKDYLARAEQQIDQAAVDRMKNASSPQDIQAIQADVARQKMDVARLRKEKPVGRMVLEVPAELQAKVSDLPDLVLEDGDRLIVPARPSSVSVFGSVFAEGSFIYKPEKSLRDYLGQAGGGTKVADDGSVYVLRADGSVVSQRQKSWFSSGLGGLALLPGDAVIVPEEYDRTSSMRVIKDWSQVFYQFGLGVASLKVLKGL